MNKFCIPVQTVVASDCIPLQTPWKKVTIPFQAVVTPLTIASQTPAKNATISSQYFTTTGPIAANAATIAPKIAEKPALIAPAQLSTKPPLKNPAIAEPMADNADHIPAPRAPIAAIISPPKINKTTEITDTSTPIKISFQWSAIQDPIALKPSTIAFPTPSKKLHITGPILAPNCLKPSIIADNILGTISVKKVPNA